MRRTKILLFSLILVSGSVIGMLGQRSLLEKNTQDQIFQAFRWRNIGPANMMGRISALDALDEDYRVVLVGSASGGVLKSTNAGVTWQPIFDEYGSGSIGDVAFFQGNADIIWVGTGEAHNRNSSGWGDGIYKSVDGGRTFQNMGLKETHQIARIATHPTDQISCMWRPWAISGAIREPADCSKQLTGEKPG